MQNKRLRRDYEVRNKHRAPFQTNVPGFAALLVTALKKAQHQTHASGVSSSSRHSSIGR